MCFKTLNPKFHFRKIGPKLRLLQAKNKLKQPKKADLPILAAFQPSRAELEQPQFWSYFSEILELRSWNTFKTTVSFWLCLKKWWITLMYILTSCIWRSNLAKACYVRLLQIRPIILDLNMSLSACTLWRLYLNISYLKYVRKYLLKYCANKVPKILGSNDDGEEGGCVTFEIKSKHLHTIDILIIMVWVK